MKSTPRVSVLMCVYNGSRYLREAVESILGQTFADFEFIVVDDGSTDDSYDILCSYQDPRIKLIRKQNTGLTDSLDVALANAGGLFLARMDADDIARADRLERQVLFLQHHPDIALIGSGAFLVDADSRITGQIRPPTSHTAIVHHLESLCSSPFPHSSLMCRREVLVEGYNARFTKAQDLDLYLRTCMKHKLAAISEPLIYLRKTMDSYSYSDSTCLVIRMAMMALVCHFRRKRGLSDPSHSTDQEWVRFRIAFDLWFDAMGIAPRVEARRYLAFAKQALSARKLHLALSLMGKGVRQVPRSLFIRGHGVDVSHCPLVDSF